MQLVSRLASRLTRLSGGRSDHSPLVLIAERFLPPAGELRHVNLPDDVLRVSDGRELDAVIVDEFGAVCRRARLLPPPPGMPGNRIDFAPIPILPGARMWLFVIDGEFDGGAITPRLVDDLLRHGRRLGGRPPIMLLFDSSNEAVLEIPDGASRPNITFAMLSEDPDPALLPPLDQPDVDTARLTAEQRAWRQDGVLVLRKFLPDSLLDPYIARREALDTPIGWVSPTPYLHIGELRRLCLYPPLRQVMRDLIGEEMMLHLNLTGWITSERDWHQDDYLNPPFINSWYAAAWIALDTIHPDSGPFEFIPGSHRWPLLRGDKVRSYMTEEELAAGVGPHGNHNWPKVSERFVVPAVEAECRRRGATTCRFLAEKGDVLIWHGRLLHRGAVATKPHLSRRAVIAHYSGINHRPDMVDRQTDAEGGTWAVFDTPLF